MQSHIMLIDHHAHPPLCSLTIIMTFKPFGLFVKYSLVKQVVAMITDDANEISPDLNTREIDLYEDMDTSGFQEDEINLRAEEEDDLLDLLPSH